MRDTWTKGDKNNNKQLHERDSVYGKNRENVLQLTWMLNSWSNVFHSTLLFLLVLLGLECDDLENKAK